jgi:hypothetical protein
MKNLSKNRKMNSESGVALLIALIALLLISGAAVAMIVASGSEGALNGNYRSSSSAYYAALAGLEEGRGRLLPTNPNLIVVNNAQGYMPVGSAQYIANPNAAAGESTATILTPYPDNQYNAEFGQAPVPLGPPIPSTSGANAANIPGPMYKWVRINAVTEFSLKADVDGDNLPNDAATPLYYDSGLTPPAIVVPRTLGPGVPNPQPTQNQVLEVTALAVLPNGSEKLLQYLVAPKTYNLDFNSPLTLAGTVGTFKGATSSPYQVNGQDGSNPTPTPVANCATNPATLKDAIGVSTTADQGTVTGGIPKNRTGNYTGANSSPDVAVVTQSSGSPFASTASLDQLLTNIKGNADAVIQPSPAPPANYNNSGTTYNFGQSGPGYTWPSDMSATNPKVIFVNGSFDLGPNTGYGLLVVTGNFQYHGNSGWKGVILVVGDGTTTFLGNGGGSGSFDGAIYVATTRDANGNLLPNFGTVNYDNTGGGGNGIYYNSCWIKQANQPPTYRVLSFKEIQYTD